MNSSVVVVPATICRDPLQSGYFFPAFSAEYQWPDALRAVLYCLGLLWFFAGVAIGADVFMCAIETITAQEKRISMEVNGKTRIFHVRVWNATVVRFIEPNTIVLLSLIHI